MRRCAIALLALCSLFTGRLPAQTKKVIANLSPEMLKELATARRSLLAKNHPE